MTSDNYVRMYEKRIVFLRRKLFENHRKEIDALYDSVEEEAIAEFEETAIPEEVAGYYLSHYGDEALTVWLDNMYYARERTYNDIRVTIILTEVSLKSATERMVNDVFSSEN